MPLLTRPSSSSPVRSLLQAAAERATPEQLALGRVGAGTVMVVRPRLLPRLLGVDSATSARVGWAVQMLGVRDAALGLGTLVALRAGDRRAARTWLAAGVLCDAVDALAVSGALARGRVSKGWGISFVATALGSVARGSAALQEDEPDI